MKTLIATAIAVTIGTAAAFAQTTPPPAAGADAAVEAKFKAADKNNSGSLEGAEVDAYKADLVKIDTDKDGKISRAEFAAASKSGVVK